MPHNERCRICKLRLHELLKAAFGNVEGQYNLKLPSRLDGYRGKSVYDDLVTIYKSLQEYRGFTEFVKAKNLPKVDFFVHKHKIIVEFDESQHFTKPRAISLSKYPDYLSLGFDKNRWIKRCNDLNRRDNDPPFRDEQRAWYELWCHLDPAKTTDVGKLKDLIMSKMEGIHETR
jgi:hypothetical protein